MTGATGVGSDGHGLASGQGHADGYVDATDTGPRLTINTNVSPGSGGAGGGGGDDDSLEYTSSLHSKEVQGRRRALDRITREARLERRAGSPIGQCEGFKGVGFTV